MTESERSPCPWQGSTGFSFNPKQLGGFLFMEPDHDFGDHVLAFEITASELAALEQHQKRWGFDAR